MDNNEMAVEYFTQKAYLEVFRDIEPDMGHVYGVNYALDKIEEIFRMGKFEKGAASSY